MAQRNTRFLLLFALANAGGVVAYVPLLTLLLPARVAAIAGGAEIEWLAAATLAGAIAASVGNIAFGWASDRVGSRRLWAAAGLALTVASYAFLSGVRTLPELVFAIVLYQLVLNMLLAPLAAWAADVVPDDRKGVLGGWLAAGPLLGSVASIVVILPAGAGFELRLAWVCLLVLVLTGPLLLWRRSPFANLVGPAVQSATEQRVRGLDLLLLWCARLLVQIAGSVLFGFLLYYFQSLPDEPGEISIAQLSAVALMIALPVSLLCGGLSDRLGRRKRFLVGAAVAASAGLSIMATATQAGGSAVGYVIFMCALSTFLSLHAGYAMQLLPSDKHRGRDLGVLNLTNTIPAVIAPVLAVWLVPGRGFGSLLALLAGFMLLAACCILFVRHDAQRA
ncbi:MFS transporter [uncultured Sphingomonas sp.]|uniref:MFS transporter n=1 Tax=uncultured Sphingomonas sp. TaxID=158754 RepID=UPI0025D75F11|nr:MFS transporter [uncultured Sphingomonas sp.]